MQQESGTDPLSQEDFRTPYQFYSSYGPYTLTDTE